MIIKKQLKITDRVVKKKSCYGAHALDFADVLSTPWWVPRFHPVRVWQPIISFDCPLIMWACKKGRTGWVYPRGRTRQVLTTRAEPTGVTQAAKARGEADGWGGRALGVTSTITKAPFARRPTPKWWSAFALCELDIAKQLLKSRSTTKLAIQLLLLRHQRDLLEQEDDYAAAH